jgi:citrate lyase synthetase
MKTKFKVGDLVECIAHGDTARANSVVSGAQYIVQAVHQGASMPMIVVNNNNFNRIYSDRFKLIGRAKKALIENNVHLSKNDIDVLKRIIKRYEENN